MLEFINQNWSPITIFLTSIGTLLNFVSEKWREKIKKPFTSKKEKIELDGDNLDFMEKYQKFQKSLFDGVLNDFEVFKKDSIDQMKEQRIVLDKREKIIEKYKTKNYNLQKQQDLTLEKLRNKTNYIKHLEELLKKNSINHDKMKVK